MPDSEGSSSAPPPRAATEKRRMKKDKKLRAEKRPAEEEEQRAAEDEEQRAATAAAPVEIDAGDLPAVKAKKAKKAKNKAPVGAHGGELVLAATEEKNTEEVVAGEPLTGVLKCLQIGPLSVPCPLSRNGPCFMTRVRPISGRYSPIGRCRIVTTAELAEYEKGASHTAFSTLEGRVSDKTLSALAVRDRLRCLSPFTTYPATIPLRRTCCQTLGHAPA